MYQNLKEIMVKNVKNLMDSIENYIELPISEQLCPFCSPKTTYIHDY